MFFVVLFQANVSPTKRQFKQEAANTGLIMSANDGVLMKVLPVLPFVIYSHLKLGC